LSGTANGAPIPTSSILVAGENPAGLQEPLQTNTAGDLYVVQAPGAIDNVNLTEVGGAAITLGQKTSAASIPVVIASDDTVAISAVALPLPAGASTSALQTAGNASLSDIDSKTPALGQALAAGSVPVVLTAAQLATLTPLSMVTVVQPTGSNLHVDVDNFPATQPVSGTVAVTQSTTPWSDNIAQFGGTAVSLGSKVSASSIPVVIASDQGALPLPTGAATSANQTTEIASLSTIATNTTGLATSANQTNGTQKSQAATPTALTIHQAAVTVGTTAVRLTVSGSAPASTRVTLVATPDVASTATFYIGSSTVTNSGSTRGVEIVAGQSFIANSDAGDYWIVSSLASQTVAIMEQY
jgi:hypothetical protein